MILTAHSFPFKFALQAYHNFARTLEPAFLYAGVHPDIIFDDDLPLALPASFWRQLGREFKAMGCEPSVHLPFRGLDLGSKSNLVRSLSSKCILTALDATFELGAKTAVMHTCCIPMFPPKATRNWVGIFAEEFANLNERATELGINLLIENVWERDTKLFEAIEKGVGTGFGYCFDIGHSRVFSKIDVEEWIAFFGKRLTTIHLHDNWGVNDDHLPPGKGNIDFSFLVGVMKDMPVKPRVILEVKPRYLYSVLHFLHKLFPDAAA